MVGTFDVHTHCSTRIINIRLYMRSIASLLGYMNVLGLIVGKAKSTKDSCCHISPS